MSVDFVGPFEHHDVVVNGYRVPYLAATPLRGGQIRLALDHRYSVDISVEESEWLVPFLADAIAVAAGYTCHPRDASSDEGPFDLTPRTRYRRMISLGPGPDDLG